jgi:hypothetical protein
LTDGRRFDCAAVGICVAAIVGRPVPLTHRVSADVEAKLR